MKTKQRRWPEWLPGAFVSLGVLAWLLLRLDVQAAWAALWQAHAGLLLAALGANMLWFLVRVHAWQMAQAQPVSFGAVLRALSGGYLLNVLLPFRLGEAGRAYFLGRAMGQPAVGVFSTVVVERLLDLLFSAGLLLFSLAFVALDAQTRFLAWGVAIGLSLGLAVLVGLTRQQARWLPALRARLGAGKLARAAVRALEEVFAGLNSLAASGRLGRYLAWMTLGWAIAILQFWLIVRAFAPHAAWWWGMFLLAATAFGGAVPSLPGALGTLEAAAAGAVFLLSGRQDLALAVGLTLRLYNYAIPFTLGVWALTKEGQSLPDLYHTLRPQDEGVRRAAD